MGYKGFVIIYPKCKVELGHIRDIIRDQYNVTKYFLVSDVRTNPDFPDVVVYVKLRNNSIIKPQVIAIGSKVPTVERCPHASLQVHRMTTMGTVRLSNMDPEGYLQLKLEYSLGYKIDKNMPIEVALKYGDIRKTGIPVEKRTANVLRFSTNTTARKPTKHQDFIRQTIKLVNWGLQSTLNFKKPEPPLVKKPKTTEELYTELKSLTDLSTKGFLASPTSTPSSVSVEQVPISLEADEAIEAAVTQPLEESLKEDQLDS